MKAVCPPGYHHNSFVATANLVSKCMKTHKAIVVITGRAHYFHDCICIYIYIIIYKYIALLYISKKKDNKQKFV